MTGINQKVLLGAIKTMRIVEELMEIWLNEVCDSISSFAIIVPCDLLHLG